MRLNPPARPRLIAARRLPGSACMAWRDGPPGRARFASWGYPEVFFVTWGGGSFSGAGKRPVSTASGRQRCWQLVARADVELLVGVAEVGLDRPGGDEQRLCDLRLLSPRAAIVATRRSLGVSASTPVSR